MIQLTDKAAVQVRSLMERDGRGDLFLRLGVKGGGCSGFLYTLAFDTDKEEADREVDLSGVKALIDPKSAILLDGITLDWYDGLDGSGWKWINPSATGTCGCGESFTV